MNDNMNENKMDKKYESFKIPNQRQAQEIGSTKAQPQTEDGAQILFDGLFYEIEYDNSPIPGAGKFVLKAQKILPAQKDETRELFYSMRDIARQYPMPYSNYSNFYDRRVQKGNASIFYKQAIFMKDFEDDYPDQASFSSYFPYYQMLGYEQLRTYFTWRTNVRRGVIANTSLSYVYLYIYELLNNIGVDNPQDGLDKLISFWTSYKTYDSSIDKYIIRWLKDYHIYYQLPQTFKEFAKEHKLTKHYPYIVDTSENFDLFCAISKYDIRKSLYYTDETNKLITDCFYYVIDKIRQEFESAGITFYDALFHPTKKLVAWTPFKGALFYNWLKQPDRREVISENEIYICTNNEWSFSTIITTDKGRQFIGYVMKLMESVLRKVTKYKYKIKANTDMVNQDTLTRLQESGLLIEKIVESATIEFYREATKTVVEVNQASLARIRQEAFVTQEALIVEEQNQAEYPPGLPVNQQLADDDIFAEYSDREHSDTKPLDIDEIGLMPSETELRSESGIWDSLKDALSEHEIQALAIILQGDRSIHGSIKEYADNNKIMLEVLADGINGKAMDYFGDNILDDELMIYEEYKENVKGMVDRYD